jgi:hypothetical protein
LHYALDTLKRQPSIMHLNALKESVHVNTGEAIRSSL